MSSFRELLSEKIHSRLINLRFKEGEINILQSTRAMIDDVVICDHIQSEINCRFNELKRLESALLEFQELESKYNEEHNDRPK